MTETPLTITLEREAFPASFDGLTVWHVPSRDATLTVHGPAAQVDRFARLCLDYALDNSEDLGDGARGPLTIPPGDLDLS